MLNTDVKESKCFQEQEYDVQTTESDEGQSSLEEPPSIYSDCSMPQGRGETRNHREEQR